MKDDIRDIPEPEMRALYAEYLAGLGRSVPTGIIRRQDRGIPGAETNGLTSDSPNGFKGHSLVVNGEVRGGELM